MPVGPHDGPRPDDEPGREGPARPEDGVPPGPDDAVDAEGRRDRAGGDATPSDDVGAARPGAPSDLPHGPGHGPGGTARDGPDEVDVDEEWRGIVDRLGPIGTASEDDAAAAAADAPAPTARRVVRPATGDPRAWAPDPAVEEAEDHFVPPDPGPVLGGDPLLTMAWTVTLGVPALVVLAVVVGARIPSLALQVGGALFLCGLGVLLWRMPREHDDGPRGPGAVV